MKRFFLLMVLLFVAGQTWAVDISAISESFKTGKSQVLKSSMENEIDLSLPGVNEKCKKEVAVMRLERFFIAKKTHSFDVLHQADKKDVGFVVAKLKTESGLFRVNITYRIESKNFYIQSIRIE